MYFAKRTQPSSLFSVKALRDSVSLQPAAHSVMLQLSGGLSRRWYTNPRPVGVLLVTEMPILPTFPLQFVWPGCVGRRCGSPKHTTLIAPWVRRRGSASAQSTRSERVPSRHKQPLVPRKAYLFIFSSLHSPSSHLRPQASIPRLLGPEAVWPSKRAHACHSDCLSAQS